MRDKHRFDEQFVMESIESFLKEQGQEPQIIPGEEPPDYYVVLHGRRIPLEITRAEIEFLDKGKRKSYLGVSSSLFNLLSDLNANYNTDDYSYSLNVHILGPVDQLRRFRKELADIIATFVKEAENYELGVWHQFDLMGERIGILKSRSVFPGSFIHGSIGPKDYVAASLIQVQTDEMYAALIRRKDAMIHPVDGEKWLGIYNAYFLAEEHNIRAALDKLSDGHGFTKIFIVVDDNIVFEVNNDSSNSAYS